MNLRGLFQPELEKRAAAKAAIRWSLASMRRQNRIARRHFEPFVVSLQGREVLYEETFFWVIRLARVVTDDWGMEALAIPQLGVSPRDYHRQLRQRHGDSVRSGRRSTFWDLNFVERSDFRRLKIAGRNAMSVADDVNRTILRPCGSAKLSELRQVNGWVGWSRRGWILSRVVGTGEY